MLLTMIDSDLSRLYQEKLMQSIGSAVSSQTGMLHVSSSWHPHKSDDLLPLAENFAWALVLCRSKVTESVFQARTLLKALIKWQRGLFPKYLHELDLQVCPHSSLRIRLVLIALLKWHRLAIGELATPLEDSLKEIEDHLPQELVTLQPVMSEPLAVYHSRDVLHFFQSHVEEKALDSSLAERLQSSMTPWHEPLWLEKPWGRVESADSLIEVWQQLIFGKIPQLTCVSQLWSVLLHEGVRFPSLPEPSERLERDWYQVSRHFPHATSKRGKPHACVLHLQTKSGQKLTLYSDLAAAEVEDGADQVLKISFRYDPLLHDALGEPANLFTLITQGTDLWVQPTQEPLDVAKTKPQMFSSVAIEHLLQAPIRHLPSGLELAVESASQKGYLHQGIYRANLLEMHLPFSCRGLTLAPLDPRLPMEMIIKIKRHL